MVVPFVCSAAQGTAPIVALFLSHWPPLLPPIVRRLSSPLATNTPGPLRAIIHKIWLSNSFSIVGPLGRALQAMRRLGWQQFGGWWEWKLPDGQGIVQLHNEYSEATGRTQA